MARLHLISQQLNSLQMNRNLSRLVANNDQLLFIGEAISGLIDRENLTLLNSCSVALLALKSDVLCRGLENKLPPSVSIIDDIKMVELTLENEQVISW